VVAISPILLYIGMLIGSQAFQETPRRHAPAIILALTPHLAAWCKLQIDNSLGAAGVTVTPDLIGKMAQTGVMYHGLGIMGGGSILAGLILGAIATFIIDRDFRKAAAFSLAGGVLTFFGFMHGEAIGINQTPGVAAAYIAVAAILFACANFSGITAREPAHETDDEEEIDVSELEGAAS
jgi:AGZA family xanthine/uracil permease-like MFS transporter